MYTGSEYNDMWVWAARAAPGRVGAGRCARWAVHRSSASSALLRKKVAVGLGLDFDSMHSFLPAEDVRR